MNLVLESIKKREPVFWANPDYGKREKTQKEVAELIGISQSYISRLEKKIIKKLRIKLESMT